MSQKKVTQPEVNIGLVGHVDHGKTTLTEALTGKWTDTHSEELKKGITIRLGYANTTVRKWADKKGIDAYTVVEKDEKGKKSEEVRKISFVDAPGHESLMATMLSGATLMDGALLLIAANEQCPQPQTKEHIMALEISGITKLIIVQNKIDIVTTERAEKNYLEIKAFLKDTPYNDAPIIPISAQQRVNIDVLLATIEEYIPTPKRDAKKTPYFFVARSFDVNKPGTEIEKIKGGVIGGAVQQGVLNVGDEIEIAPGHKVEKKGKVSWERLKTKIIGIKTGTEDIESAQPGGSIALLTELDPAIVKSDALTGNVIGHNGKLPPVWETLQMELHLLKRMVGAKDDLVIEAIKLKELFLLNANARATVGVVDELKKNTMVCSLKLPICAEPETRVTISRRVGSRWRLIGYGIIKK